MSQRILKCSLLCILTLCLKVSKAQSEDVEVVIATTMNMSQASAFSPDNRLVAMALYNAISIWDVKTGRMLRNTNYTDNLGQVTDSIWFSEDSKKVIVGLAVSNDVFEVDVVDGKSTFVKGAPFDYSNYKYAYSIRTASTMHLYSGKKNDLEYPSPDGSTSIYFKLIKNPLGNSQVMPNAYTTHVRIKGKLSEPIDTVMQANFVFSKDSRYVFTESTIIDLKNGNEVSSLRIVPYSGRSVMFLPNTHTPVTSGVQSVRVWDFPDVIDIPVENMINFRPSLDGNVVICETYDMQSGSREYVKVDLVKKKVISKPLRTKETGYLLNVSDDADRFCFLEMLKQDQTDMTITYNVKICEASTGKIIKNIPGTTKCFFTPDPDVVLIDSMGRGNFKYNLKTGQTDYFSTEPSFINSGFHLVSDDHQYLLGASSLNVDKDGIVHNKVEIWEIATAQKVFEAEIKGINISAFNVSNDKKQVSFASSYEHAIFVYDLATAQRKHTLKGHTAIVEVTRFSDDGMRLISSALDGTRRIWNLETGKEMVSLVNTGRNDYAIITPNQYYYATKGAKELIHFVKGIDIYPFSQFDLKYNRPDIIITSLEASNQGLVKPFYYAYQKRLKRLGFTEEMLDGAFHMPEAAISNADAIPISTQNGTINLNIRAKDKLYNLDRLVVRVNEVPIHGKDGVSLRNKNVSSYEEKVPVQLSSGKNTIEVSVMNEKGVESLASTVIVDYEPNEVRKPNLYLYTIGVSKYAQSEYNLTYAAKDAADIETLFKSGAQSFGQVITKQLTNEQVTIESVKNIKDDLSNTQVDDAVCIFFAGHGILDVDLNYFLASYDIDFKDPGTKGIPYEVFEDLLDDIPARKKLILIDACHSGEIDKEEVALIESENTENSEQDISFRAVNSTTLKQVGLTNSFELMKELFNDLRKSSGTVIISSAGGMEYAMEGGEWNNGVFTYSFLNGIKNGKADTNGDGVVMLSEVNSFVREEVFNLTNGRQQPTTRAATLDQDWRLW